MPDSLAALIRTIPDHPKPGILYRDISTLILDPKGLRRSIELLAERVADQSFDLVAGIEARGFIFGSALACHRGVGFVPLRKPGKLPGETVSQSYALEYGTDTLELHSDAVRPGTRVLVIDDLIATGGTAVAGVELLRSVGAVVETCAFVVALPDLGGIQRLEGADCRVDWLVSFDGD